MIILVSTIEPVVTRVPGVFQTTIVVIPIAPGHRAVGGIAATHIRVLVIHVVERVRGRLQTLIVGCFLTRGVAIGHALACAPRTVGYVRSEAGHALRVLIGPETSGGRE